MVLVSGGDTRQVIPTGRARGIAATISALFAVIWFGWGTTEAVSSALTQLLQIGRGLGVVVALLGVALAVCSQARSTAMTDPAVRRGYGIVVGLEFGLLGVGNVVLSSSGLELWIPVWICAGVGVHFIPLSRVFGEASLMVLGAVLTAVAAVALVAGLGWAVAPSTIVGTGAGLCLLVFAVITLTSKKFFTGVPVGVSVTASSLASGHRSPRPAAKAGRRSSMSRLQTTPCDFVAIPA